MSPGATNIQICAAIIGKARQSLPTDRSSLVKKASVGW
jgi:hypothetical protein